MASACVNNIGMSPDNFKAPPYPSYGWLSPRASFSREFPEDDYSKPIAFALPPLQEEKQLADPPLDLEFSPGDFEFCLEDPVAMLPADELFSDGKLVPLQLSAMKTKPPASTEIQSPDLSDSRRRSDMSAIDLYIMSSPKAPRCSSRWKELLGLKKMSQNASAKNGESTATTRKGAAAVAAAASSSSSNSRSIRHFLHRSAKSSSSSDSSLNLPLLKELDSDSVLVSSRHSLSSSSSGGHEHEDLPRLSLDSEKPYSLSLHKNPNITNPPRMRLVKPRAENPRPMVDNPGANSVERSPNRRTPVESGGITPRGVSIDSPRMNASGKVIFQSLERSSSSPSTFNGGPRYKHRGMERSYSAGVRVTPVLNVPVSSLMGSSKSFGFGPLFSSSASPQKREVTGNVGGVGGGSSRSYQQLNSRNRFT